MSGGGRASGRAGRSSARVGGGGSGEKEKELFTVGKDGVRVYDDLETDSKTGWLSEHSTSAVKAFRSLSDVHCNWNKGFDVLDGDKKPVHMKRSQQWDYLKNQNINSFILRVSEGDKKRALKQMEDYGYHVVAKLASNSKDKRIFDDNEFYMSKKKMQRLGLDFKVETYWKKGWKG